jgi:DNA-binding MarR family transcriptional regulator
MGLHIRRAARRITRIFDEQLAPLDLSIGQFSLLSMLAGKEAWRMQPLADDLGTDRTSLTAMLKPLERRLLVISLPDERDGRTRLLAITDQGRRLFAQAIPLWLAAQDEVLATLGTGNAAEVRTILRRLT